MTQLRFRRDENVDGELGSARDGAMFVSLMQYDP